MRGKAKTPYLLKRGIADAKSSDGEAMRPLVLDQKRDRKLAVMARPVSRVMTVKENLLRIQQKADPIDFLIRVQNGEAIPSEFVDRNGEVHTAYETASLTDRIGVAKFMASKVLPTLNVTQHILSDSPPEGGAEPGKGGVSFAALVSAAAARATNIVDGAAYEPAEEGEEDGGQADGAAEDPGDGDEYDRHLGEGADVLEE